MQHMYIWMLRNYSDFLLDFFFLDFFINITFELN